MQDVTQILNRIERGDHAAANELLPQVYETLKRMARKQMVQEHAGHTLQPTALVHEAYLRLLPSPASFDWRSRGQFYSAAAVAMRRILIEHARQRMRLKRGGGQQRVSLDVAAPAVAESYELLALDEALSRLAAVDSRKAKLVELRCFAGLDREELSNTLGISMATVDRDWLFAKAWLLRELGSAEHFDQIADPSN